MIGIFRRIRRIEERLARIESELLRGEDPLRAAAEAAGVPLAQVIKEYLWGEDDA